MSSDNENDLWGESSPAAQAPSPAPASRHPDPDDEDEPAEREHHSDGEGGGDGNDDGEGGGDIFGDDSDGHTHASQRSSRAGSENPLEYPEEDEDVEELQEVWANVPLPQWPRLKPTDGKVWHLKLPGYVNLESQPYDPELYRATCEDDGELKPVEARAKMIGVRNTIRWKWVNGPHGPERRSNARMLRWSDGSVSLQLGSDLFDLAPSYGSTLARPQDAAPPPAAEAGNAETSFLCYTSHHEQVLVAETAIAGQVSLVPTSMDSKTHRELVNHVGQQHIKHSRMKILDDIGDQNKVAELLARAAPQRPVATKRPSRPGANRYGGPGGRSRLKRADSEDSGFGSPERRRREASYDEDDGFVVADTDDESDGESRRRKKRRDREEDLDEMEIAERLLEERDRARKKARKSKPRRKHKTYSSDEDEEEEPEAEETDDDADGEADDMDVESEEE